MFTEFGNISYCKIVMNTQTGLPKGTAFVQFKDSEAAESCITAANTTDGKVSVLYTQYTLNSCTVLGKLFTQIGLVS